MTVRMVASILCLVLLHGCVEEGCDAPETWGEAWSLDRCETVDGGTSCVYSDQTCHYLVYQEEGTCSWVEQEFWC